MHLGLALRSLWWTLLLPSVVAGYVPWRFFGLRTVVLDAGRPTHWAGLLGVAVGAGLLAACIFEFARSGRGTLAPLDAPQAEEPTLRRRFGQDYQRYCLTVNRWLPGRPWGS